MTDPPQGATATLGLVVCTAGRPHCVERLLAAVAAQSRVPDEVLVVDGSAAPEARATETVAAGAPLSVRYLLVDPGERGLTRQRNRGIAELSTDLIAFLDDDTVPSPNYFEDLEQVFHSRPDAVGVGGWIDDGVWRPCPSVGGRESGPPCDGDAASDAADRQEHDAVAFVGGRVRVGGHERVLGTRWRLRRWLGLAPPFEPGRIPAEGHGWPVSFVPPGRRPVDVDCIMGGASAWRRTLFERVQFSPWFDGYGLYEDQDFSIRASRHGALVLCPSARLAHLHEPTARPRAAHYGRMVVRNGWRVWRTGNPDPRPATRLRWWLVTLLLLLVGASNGITGPSRRAALAETWGRVRGVVEVLARGVPLDEAPRGGAAP